MKTQNKPNRTYLVRLRLQKLLRNIFILSFLLISAVTTVTLYLTTIRHITQGLIVSYIKIGEILSTSLISLLRDEANIVKSQLAASKSYLNLIMDDIYNPPLEPVEVFDPVTKNTTIEMVPYQDIVNIDALTKSREQNITMQGYDFVTDNPPEVVQETRDFDRIIWYTEPRQVPVPAGSDMDQDVNICAASQSFQGLSLLTPFQNVQEEVIYITYIGTELTQMFCNAPFEKSGFFNAEMQQEDYYCDLSENPKWYNPRCRPWYIDQKANQEFGIFTDLYQFAALSMFGISACNPLHVDGQFVGAMCADIPAYQKLITYHPNQRQPFNFFMVINPDEELDNMNYMDPEFLADLNFVLTNGETDAPNIISNIQVFEHKAVVYDNQLLLKGELTLIPTALDLYPNIGSTVFYFIVEDYDIQFDYLGTGESPRDELNSYKALYFFQGVEIDAGKQEQIDATFYDAYTLFILYLSIVTLILLILAYCRMHRLSQKITRPVVILLERIETMLQMKDRKLSAVQTNFKKHNQETGELELAFIDMSKTLFIATSAAQMGDDSNALLHYHEALMVYRKFKNISQAGVCLTNIGCINLSSKDYTKAIYYFELAVKNSQEQKEIARNKNSSVPTTKIGFTKACRLFQVAQTKSFILIKWSEYLLKENSKLDSKEKQDEFQKLVTSSKEKIIESLEILEEIKSSGQKESLEKNLFLDFMIYQALIYWRICVAETTYKRQIALKKWAIDEMLLRSSSVFSGNNENSPARILAQRVPLTTDTEAYTGTYDFMSIHKSRASEEKLIVQLLQILDKKRNSNSYSQQKLTRRETTLKTLTKSPANLSSSQKLKSSYVRGMTEYTQTDLIKRYGFERIEDQDLLQFWAFLQGRCELLQGNQGKAIKTLTSSLMEFPRSRPQTRLLALESIQEILEAKARQSNNMVPQVYSSIYHYLSHHYVLRKSVTFVVDNIFGSQVMLNVALQFVKKTFDELEPEDKFGYIKLHDGMNIQLALEEKGATSHLKEDFLKNQIESSMVKLDNHGFQINLMKSAITQAIQWQAKIAKKEINVRGNIYNSPHKWIIVFIGKPGYNLDQLDCGEKCNLIVISIGRGEKFSKESQVLWNIVQKNNNKKGMYINIKSSDMNVINEALEAVTTAMEVFPRSAKPHITEILDND